MFLMYNLILTGSAFKLVCYFTNWSQYRQDRGKFLPKDIDPKLCTHLIYAFAGMKDNKITMAEWNDEQLYKDFNNHKKTYGASWGEVG